MSDTSAVCITLTGSVSLRFTSTLLGLNPCIPLSTWIPWTPRIPWNPWFPWIPWIQRMHRTSGIHIVHGCAESMCSNDSMDSIVSCKIWNWVNSQTDFTLIHPPAPPHSTTFFFKTKSRSVVQCVELGIVDANEVWGQHAKAVLGKDLGGVGGGGGGCARKICTRHCLPKSAATNYNKQQVACNHNVYTIQKYYMEYRYIWCGGGCHRALQPR